MKAQEIYELICTELETSMNRLTAILTYDPDMSNDDKLVVLSIFELIGASLASFGDIVQSGDRIKIDKALQELRDIQLRMSFIIDKHPLIESLGA